jgi:hypothetical protein
VPDVEQFVRAVNEVATSAIEHDGGSGVVRSGLAHRRWCARSATPGLYCTTPWPGISHPVAPRRADAGSGWPGNCAISSKCAAPQRARPYDCI